MLCLFKEYMKLTTVLGAGLLIGTALAVIIPEGVHTVYSAATATGKIFYYPRVFRRKKGDYVLPFVVRPSVRPSVRKQFTSISSYTIDARITKPICMIPLCIQMVATYLKFFYIFQFWNNSDFSDFTQKCNFSGNFSRNWFKFFRCMGESHIHHISNGFYHVISRSSPKMEI